VKSLRFGEGYYLGEDQFVHLLRAMPHLEFLDLDVKFQMDGETLRELVLHCPRLVVLDLRYTQLHLSIGTMIGLHPFRQLETMRFACIYFKDLPRLQSDAGLTIATLWRRIFPRLRHVACFSDRSHAMEDDWSEESEADNDGTSDDDTSIRLWRVLRYGKDWLIYTKIIYVAGQSGDQDDWLACGAFDSVLQCRRIHHEY
jgi:hypothetical protein